MDEKNYRKGEKYMKQNRPDETGFEKMSDEELVAAICGRVTECLGDNYYPKIKVDHAYVK